MPMQPKDENARRRMERLATRITRRTRLTALRIFIILTLFFALFPFLGAAIGLWRIDKSVLWLALVFLSYAVAAKVLWDQESDLRFLFDHPELIHFWKRKNSDQAED